MGVNDHRRTPPAASPKLARKHYHGDSSNSSSNDGDSDSDGDSSDSSSSLLILPPIRDKTLNHPGYHRGNNDKIGKCSNNSTDAKMVPQKKPPPTAVKRATELATKTKIRSDANTEKRNSNFSDTDDDDDDAFLFRSKRVFQKSKQHQGVAVAKATTANDGEKQRKKREREAQKETEKQQRIQKRKQEKGERERRKEEEKLAKKQQNEEHYQAMGKYSHEEIAVLLDMGRSTDDPRGLVEALSADFLVHPYQSRIAEGLPSRVTSIEFIRKNKLSGGAKEAVASLEAGRASGKSKSHENNQGYEHIHYLAVLFEPDDFIPLLRRDAQEEEDDYPALERWLDNMRSRWQRAWSYGAAAEPKIIFLLIDLPDALDKKWIDYRRHNRNSSRREASLPTVKDLQDAMQWVLVQFQVECILCPNDEYLRSTVHKMTRGLCERPYINQVTELECIKKIKQGCLGSTDPLEKAKDVWLRQLQQLPGVSENKAQHIAEHFPTCQSLWQAYQWEHHRQSETEEEGNDADALCSALLEDKFSADNKRYRKLSDSLYRVLSSNDPFAMIL
jgi:hypothetical protein